MIRALWLTTGRVDLKSNDYRAQQQLFGFQIELHDDKALYGHVYAYELGHQSMTGVFYPGQSFSSMLERLCAERRVLSPHVANLLTALDSAYSSHFYATMKRGV